MATLNDCLLFVNWTQPRRAYVARFLLVTVIVALTGATIGSDVFAVPQAERGKIALHEVVHVKAHPKSVIGLAFSRDGRTLATSGSDRVIRLWNLATMKETGTLVGHTGMANRLAFSTDGKSLVSGSRDGTVRVWDLDKHTVSLTLDGHQGPVQAMALFPGGMHIVTGDQTKSATGTIRIWDLSTGREKASVASYHSAIRALAVSPDGQVLASAGTDGTVRLWDVASRVETAVLMKVSPKEMDYILFTHDGKTLITSGNDFKTHIWNVGARKEIKALAQDGHYVAQIAVSPDGRMLATAGMGKVHLWDLTDFREIDTFHGLDDEWVSSIAFSPDGKKIAAGRSDGFIQVLALDSSTNDESQAK